MMTDKYGREVAALSLILTTPTCVVDDLEYAVLVGSSEAYSEKSGLFNLKADYFLIGNMSEKQQLEHVRLLNSYKSYVRETIVNGVAFYTPEIGGIYGDRTQTYIYVYLGRRRFEIAHSEVYKKIQDGYLEGGYCYLKLKSGSNAYQQFMRLTNNGTSLTKEDLSRLLYYILSSYPYISRGDVHSQADYLSKLSRATFTSSSIVFLKKTKKFDSFFGKIKMKGGWNKVTSTYLSNKDTKSYIALQEIGLVKL